MLSYKALTLGLGLLVAIPLVVKLTSVRNEGQSCAPAVIELGGPSAEQVGGAKPRSRARQDLLTRATVVGRSPRAGGGGLDKPGRLPELTAALSTAGPREQATAAVLTRFAVTGSMEELRRLDRQDVGALADHLVSELSPQGVEGLLGQTLGFSTRTGLTEESARSTLTAIYDALAGHRVAGVRPSVLVVTDAADANGTIIGRSNEIPVGTERVYAVFENDHALKGLDQVMAVWRDPNDDQLVFTEFEPIREGAAYNFVSLGLESGWPEGRYRVELFHPERQSLLLGAENFGVR